MIKKLINQNTNYDLKLLKSIEYNYIFDNKPINRLNNKITNKKKLLINKDEQIQELKKQINSIEDCSLKKNSQKLVLGDGNINSSMMLIGEAPGIEENKSGTF